MISAQTLELARKHRRATATGVYSAATFLALSLAFLARWEFDPAVLGGWEFAGALLVLIPVRLAFNYWFRLGMSQWRFVGTQDFVRLLAALSAGTITFWAVTWAAPVLPNVPRSIILLEWVFSGYLTGGIWVMYRLVYERGRRRSSRATTPRRRVLVVGAGEAGQQLVHQMKRSWVGYEPVGFVDDDPGKWGTLIHGVEVVGGTMDIQEIAAGQRAEEIVVGIPSATPAELRELVGRCEPTRLPLKMLPGIDHVLGGSADLSFLREIRIEDLLGRDPVDLELPHLAEALGGKTILITGAAGSIGSELVRQITRHRPGRIVLVDQAETPLHYLDLEIRKGAPDVEAVCVVGDVTHPPTLERIFQRHRPDWVFHAAAYKHVPMMERNPREAVRTNVLGTALVARAAGASGAERFVLVSTDKAVRPSNVMGATKHLAERLVLALQGRYPETRYGAVRFGNVLDSNGSVLPLFRQQIEKGEPLTVTHEEVSRYFMTIPEAVQLVLQASLLPGLRGRVAMLEMGKPVRILDLARDMLRLSGRPFLLGETVVVTGLRPGEKLHEELAAPDERVEPTEVDRVLLVNPAGDEPNDLASVLSLETLDEERILDLLCDRFPELCCRDDGELDVAGRLAATN